MNLKTILFITLFLSAIVISYQTTADSLVEQARQTEKRAVNELKKQAKDAKAQFKSAYNQAWEKLKAVRAGSSEKTEEDTSDSDTIIQKAITEATNVADQVKQTEWTGIRDLKAQAQKAKQAFKDAKAKFKASHEKSSSSSSSDSSDTDAGEGVVDKVKRAAEWSFIATLKGQANTAKAAAKAAYNKLRNRNDDSSSSSSDSSDTDESTLKEKVTEAAKDKVEDVAADAAGSIIDQAKEAQRAAYEHLKAEARKAKETFQNAYRALKARIRAERSGQGSSEPVATAEESSSSSSSSSDSSDGILEKARRYSRQLLDQVERAKNQATDAIKEKVDTEL